MEKITRKHLSDKNNHVGCECGNLTIYEYSWSDWNGEYNNCPSCMVEWQSQQIKAMKTLVYELSTKSKEETSKLINSKYAEIMGVHVCDFEDDIDFSII